MTEQDWHRCTDPERMLSFLKGKTSDRKLRLFICACCRQIWSLLTDIDSRHAVEAGEAYADGKVTAEQLAAARAAARMVTRRAARPPFKGTEWYAASAAWRAAAGDVCWAVSKLPWYVSGVASAAATQKLAFGGTKPGQAATLRCIIGATFRTITLSPAILCWNNGLVVRLAQAAYDERQMPEGTLDNHRLAVLADALEEAGADAELAAHLRETGQHYRGCWCLDLLTGKP